MTTKCNGQTDSCQPAADPSGIRVAAVRRICPAGQSRRAGQTSAATPAKPNAEASTSGIADAVDLVIIGHAAGAIAEAVLHPRVKRQARAATRADTFERAPVGPGVAQEGPLHFLPRHGVLRARRAVRRAQRG